MDDDIQTTLVSIVKEEDIEIKEEPVEDYAQYNREEKNGVLGNFYQVECNAGPMECMVEEEEPQKNVKGCACSKELERLESRMGRLECLLELLVSKVATPRNTASPPPASTSPSPRVSEEAGWSPATCSNGSSKTTVPLPSIKLISNPITKTVSSTGSEHTVEHKEKSNIEIIEDESDLPPLVKAAQSGDLHGVELSLKSRPPPKQVGEALVTASCPSVVELISRAYPEMIHGPLGVKALLSAAEWGRVAMLRALLDAGVDPSTPNRSTLTALHKAATKGHVDCVRVLLERGADVLAITSSSWSALHMAAMSGATDCMETLVEAGAEIEAQDKTGFTALHYAARWNQDQAVEWLLDKGACQTVKNMRGKTPRDLANAEETLKLLTKPSKAESSEDEVPLCKRLKELKKSI